jgi:hypothetical protein
MPDAGPLPLPLFFGPFRLQIMGSSLKSPIFIASPLALFWFFCFVFFFLVLEKTFFCCLASIAQCLGWLRWSGVRCLRILSRDTRTKDRTGGIVPKFPKLSPNLRSIWDCSSFLSVRKVDWFRAREPGDKSSEK